MSKWEQPFPLLCNLDVTTTGFIPAQTPSEESAAADEWILLVDPSIDTTQKKSCTFNGKKDTFFRFFRVPDRRKQICQPTIPPRMGKWVSLKVFNDGKQMGFFLLLSDFILYNYLNYDSAIYGKRSILEVP